jgi:hypothetical protein
MVFRGLMLVVCSGFFVRGDHMLVGVSLVFVGFECGWCLVYVSIGGAGC